MSADLATSKQVHRARRFARPVLVEALGTEGAAAVEARVAEEYARVASGIPRLRAPTSRMTLRLAVDALVLYRSLPSELAREDCLALVARFVARWMAGQFETRPARWVYSHRLPHLLLRRWWFWQANRLDEPEGWRFRFVPGTHELFYGVDVTRCGAVAFLRAQGAPELAPILCTGDHHITGHLPPGVSFSRTQVIAAGAPTCDFRYPYSARGTHSGRGGG